MSDENLFTTFIGDKRQKETEIADSLESESISSEAS